MASGLFCNPKRNVQLLLLFFYSQRNIIIGEIEETEQNEQNKCYGDSEEWKRFAKLGSPFEKGKKLVKSLCLIKATAWVGKKLRPRRPSTRLWPKEAMLKAAVLPADPGSTQAPRGRTA